MAGKIFLALCLFGVALQTQCFTYQTRNEDKVDMRYVKIAVDGQEYELNLKQRVREIFYENTPVWTLSAAEGLTFTKVNQENRFINGIFYDDDEYMASLLATYNEEKTQIYYDGVVGVGTNTHAVHAVPEEWWTSPQVDEETSEDDKEQTDEVSEQKVRSAYVPGENAGSLDEPLSVLHPKILAVVDYDLYKKLGENVDEVVKYVVTFFDAIDLRYQKLGTPNVELFVTGIVILTDSHATTVTKETSDYFDKYFIEATEYVNYDTAFVFKTTVDESLKEKTHLGSICNRAYSTVFVQDNAAFGGLITATHELGHLLNLPHDGHDAAESCKVTSGENTTVMAASIGSVRSLEWSKCSRNILTEFTKSQAAECLRDSSRNE